MIGSGFPYSEFLPKEGDARGVQIDIKPDMLSLRYPMEVPPRRREKNNDIVPSHRLSIAAAAR